MAEEEEEERLRGRREVGRCHSQPKEERLQQPRLYLLAQVKLRSLKLLRADISQKIDFASCEGTFKDSCQSVKALAKESPGEWG